MKIALPLLLVGLVVGLIVSVFQSVTQIQEQTLTFIPKIVATRRGRCSSPVRGCSASCSATPRSCGCAIPALVGGG